MANQKLDDEIIKQAAIAAEKREGFCRIAAKLNYSAQANLFRVKKRTIERFHTGHEVRGLSEQEKEIATIINDLKILLLDCSTLYTQRAQAKKHNLSVNTIKRAEDMRNVQAYRQKSDIEDHYRNNICFSCPLPECKQSKTCCPLLQEASSRKKEVYYILREGPKTTEELGQILGTDKEHASSICKLLSGSKLAASRAGKWHAK